MRGQRSKSQREHKSCCRVPVFTVSCNIPVPAVTDNAAGRRRRRCRRRCRRRRRRGCATTTACEESAPSSAIIVAVTEVPVANLPPPAISTLPLQHHLHPRPRHYRHPLKSQDAAVTNSNCSETTRTKRSLPSHRCHGLAWPRHHRPYCMRPRHRLCLARPSCPCFRKRCLRRGYPPVMTRQPVCLHLHFQ